MPSKPDEAWFARLKAAAKHKGLAVEEYEDRHFMLGLGMDHITWRHYILNGKAASLIIVGPGRARLTFHDETIDINFWLIERMPLRQLLRTLCGEIGGEEIEMLKGVSLTRSAYARTKLMRLFLEGDLDLATVARTLFRNLAYAKRRSHILAVSEWLKRNGFKHMAMEAVVAKGLF